MITIFFVFFAAAFTSILKLNLLRLLVPTARTRELVLYFFLWNGTLCWIYVEAFSLFNAINYTSARLYWSGITFLELVIFILKGKKHWVRYSQELFVRNGSSLFQHLKGNRSIVIASTIIVVPLFFLAIFTPPNNFDSNSYHLHRILAWVHYGNVNLFPTTHIQQLYHNVFAEYLVLNVYLISGSDRFLSLVQYFAGLGCISTLTLLASQLGLNRTGQILAAFVLLTLPIGVFELTTTQVDYVASCFFVSFLYFGYKLEDSFSWKTLIGMGLSLSFAAFTKYPILFYALPFCIYFGFSYLKRYKLKYSVIILLSIAICLLTIFSPFWKRNYDLFGHVLSPPENSPFFAEKLQSDAHNAAFTISSLIKNSSLHLGIPYSGFNKRMEDIIVKIHHAINVDINQAEISEDLFSVRYSVHEDMIPNSLHFYLILLSTPFILLIRGNIRVKIFWLLAILGYIIFCTLLKFQLWSTRTHMPFFVMGSIVIALFLQRQPKFIGGVFLISIYVPALFFVFGNPSKPVFSLPYLAKKATAHIPSVICLNSDKDALVYQNKFSNIYKFPEDNANCASLKFFPGFSERREVFKNLDALGYYDSIKRTVFSMERSELYFLNDKEKYEYFRPLIDKITGETPGIAVMSYNGEGYYFYHSALKASKKINADFNYILFKKEFDTLDNTFRDFCYTYVLTDDPYLVMNHLGRERIKNIYNEGEKLILIELKEKSCNHFTY